MNNRVIVGDYTFISDSKTSDTVTVITDGAVRVMRREDAVALYNEHVKSDRRNQIVPPQGRRVAFAGTNELRHK